MYKSLIISTNNNLFANSKLDDILNHHQIKQGGPDFLEIRALSSTISIKQTREMQVWGVLKPYSSNAKLAVFYEAEKLSLEAQNSMLKILEEPYEHLNIVLITKNYKRLLSTIISRCELVQHHEINILSENPNEYSNISNLNLIDRLQLVDQIIKIKEARVQKAKVEELLIELLNYYRRDMFHSSTSRQNVKLIDNIYQKLNSNVSKKILLENLMLNLG